MRKLTLPLLVILAGIILYVGCKKSKDACGGNPGYSLVPAIQLSSISFTTDSAVSYGKIDTIIISFTDGGKDLVNKPGDDTMACIAPAYYFPPVSHYDSCLLNDPTRNLFLVDERDSVMLGYQINSSDTVALGAKGITTCGYDGQIKFPVQLFDHKCGSGYGAQCQDTVVFKIFVRDNSGNFSNIIETPPIVLIPTP